jgi:hypothetical protein
LVQIVCQVVLGSRLLDYIVGTVWLFGYMARRLVVWLYGW